MLIYILNYLTIPLYAVIFKNRKYFIFIMSVQLFLILSLRGLSVGADTITYSLAYEAFAGYGIGDIVRGFSVISGIRLGEYNFEAGYVILTWFLSKIGISFRVFLFIYSAFLVIVWGRFVGKNSKDPVLTYCLFLALGMFTYYFAAIRQSIAVSILLMSWHTIKDRKPVRFLIYLFFAFLFHRVTLIFLPLYIVSAIRMDRKMFVSNFVLWMAELVMIPLVFHSVIVKLMSLFGKAHYFHSDIEMNNLIVAMIAFAVIAFFTINFKTFFNERVNNVLCWGFLLGIAVEIVGMYIYSLARAVVSVYFVFATLLIPNIIEVYPSRHIKALGKVAVYFAALLFMITQLADSNIVPYVFMFQI